MSHALRPLPVLLHGQYFACEAGCGKTVPRVEQVEYSRTEDHFDNVVESKTAAVWRSTCCSSNVLVYDRVTDDVVALDALPLKIYLAGFDVFRTDAAEYGDHLKSLCRQHRFEGMYPLDAEVDVTLPRAEQAKWIYQRNIERIRQCDVVMANLADFRGTGEPDTGTAFEIGFAIASGKPVFAYMPDTRPLAERMANMDSTTATVCDKGFLIENFGLPVNLMLACSATIVHGGPESCLDTIAAHFHLRRSSEGVTAQDAH